MITNLLKTEQVRKVAIVLMLSLGYLALQCIILRFHSPEYFDRSVFDLSFGFGDVTRHLIETGTFKIPFDRENALLYASAARMPLLPAVFAGLHLLSDRVLFAFIAKNFLLNICMFSAILHFCCLHRVKAVHLMIIAFPLITPQTILHSGTVDYEEGFVIQLLAITVALFFSLLSPNAVAMGKRKEWWGFSLSVALEYLSKSSLLLCSTFNICAGWAIDRSRFNAMRLLLPFAISVVGWGLINYTNTGVFNIGSSLAGSYSFRSNSDWSYENYPVTTLDEMPWVSPYADKRIEQNDFSSEWHRDSYMLEYSRRWISQNPQRWAELLGRHFWVLFIEVRNTPGSQGRIDPRGPIQWLGVLFMLGNRLIEVVTLSLTCLFIWQRRQTSTRIFHAAFYYYGFVCAYSIPCIIGWTYERHAIPLLIPTAMYLTLLLALSRPSSVESTAAICRR